MTQLALNLRLKDGSSFDNFHPARNREAIERLRAALAAGERAFYLWGVPGSGKTHLLQAACRQAQEQGRAVAYIPLAQAAEFTTAILDDVDTAQLVCLDDVDRIAGNGAWETALFALCERLRAAGGLLVAAGAANPRHLGLAMPELATRLGWGPVYQLHPLSDADKLMAVRLRARNRGLEMAEDVARFILNRCPRDMNSLFDLLDRIDRAALASQRRITIPFVRGLDGVRITPVRGRLAEE
ncbi:MAG: DnaA regulatory inactivator Hda [Candidatus Muproteobacteria bacterium RIFCSPHIGHO2_02_FULL_65_16]|uniref:DnaA regulatory inactivator Hda n=1 Tax=Candidatus Muproteobacteria bacterium RIFCSPHIGHO2_02_FULL_65_16 TaxID=1817766 RepID=A0A1F6TXC0_9PROT|nr:MAG: DnaA regulatory inactivator Hda [Candidatus Muproteobacteria bacterium RIFCSPHIGHO2_02_FULL_65_16]